MYLVEPVQNQPAIICFYFFSHILNVFASFPPYVHICPSKCLLCIYFPMLVWDRTGSYPPKLGHSYPLLHIFELEAPGYGLVTPKLITPSFIQAVNRAAWWSAHRSTESENRTQIFLCHGCISESPLPLSATLLGGENQKHMKAFFNLSTSTWRMFLLLLFPHG